MAKGRSRSYQRDFRNQSLSSMLAPVTVVRPLEPMISPVVQLTDDRLFNPSRPVPGPAFFSTGPTQVARTFNRVKFRADQVARILDGSFLAEPFETRIDEFRDAYDPVRRVSVCVRRKVRREVMFALGRRGKGSGSKRRKTWRSKIKC